MSLHIALATMMALGRAGGTRRGGGLIFILYVVFTVMAVVAVVKILSKTGYSGWWALFAIVPVVNIAMLLVFAFATWPVEREIEAARHAVPPMAGPGPAPTYAPPAAPYQQQPWDQPPPGQPPPYPGSSG